jgi:glycosyltransferase involved in cell wall biosynthesis
MFTKYYDLSRVAQLCYGDELYGVGTVQRLYAEGAPDMLFVCQRTGPLYDYLVERKRRVVIAAAELEGFSIGNSLMGAANVTKKLLTKSRSSRSLSKTLKGEGVEVLHSHWLPHHLTAGKLRTLGFKSIWHLHTSMSSRRLLGLGPVINNLLARTYSDALIAVSNFVAADWRRSGRQCFVIHNASLASTGPDVGQERVYKPPYRTIFASRLTKEKGAHTAIAAVIAARQQGFDVTLDIFGGPLVQNDYVTSLEQQIKSGRAEEAIKLKGFCSNLAHTLGEYHLGFHCMEHPEPCSVWVCEAGFAGLPLIASETGGTQELITPNVSGFLYNPSKPEDVAHLLIKNLTNLSVLEQMDNPSITDNRQRFAIRRFISESQIAYSRL